MIEPGPYLLDTNILLRMTRRGAQGDKAVDRALELLTARRTLYFTHQNIAEFWNVCTRPVHRNGFRLSVVDVEATVSMFEQRLMLLADGTDVYREWRRLVRTHRVSGVQVHDARLVAAMLVHDVPNILTFKIADFQRYPGIAAVHPARV